MYLYLYYVCDFCIHAYAGVHGVEDGLTSGVFSISLDLIYQKSLI